MIRDAFNVGRVGGSGPVGVATAWSTVISAATVGAGGTMTTRKGFDFLDGTGSGAITNQIAIDIPTLSKGGTLNIGIRNAASFLQSGASTFTGTVNVTDVNVVLGTTTGTKIGTATTQKLGFYNATPIVQPSAYTQTYSTADKTHANPTAATLTDNTAGTANTTLEALTSGSVYATDVAAIRNNFADLAAMVNKNTADMLDVKQIINSVIDDLQALGLVG
jgi:hypothetical protein